MNDHKIAFIICCNDELFLNETTAYLNRLIVPEGYEVELLVISEAQSMLAGMTEGKDSTDAKYKVFMHQDVFILNRNFIADLLAIFQSDETIGLVGMIGCKKVAADGIMWSEVYDGTIYIKGVPISDYSKYQYSVEKDGMIDVTTVDGLLMATSQDIPLRTDLFTGWDFYDLSTSLEYKRAGYRVVVPNQRTPWVLHDDGKYLSLWNYDIFRKIALEEYADYIVEEEGLKEHKK